MNACTGTTCRQGRAPCLSHCGLVMASPHGRFVDTEIHEAPQIAPERRPPTPTIKVNPMLAFFRLLRHHRKSGQALFPAIARAWSGRK